MSYTEGKVNPHFKQSILALYICRFLYYILHKNVLYLSNLKNVILKGVIHSKMKILLSFTHPQVVPNLYEFLCFAEHKGRYFEESL